MEMQRDLISKKNAFLYLLCISCHMPHVVNTNYKKINSFVAVSFGHWPVLAKICIENSYLDLVQFSSVNSLGLDKRFE